MDSGELWLQLKVKVFWKMHRSFLGKLMNNCSKFGIGSREAHSAFDLDPWHIGRVWQQTMREIEITDAQCAVEGKSSRHDANDRVGLTIDLDSMADHRGVTMEVALPEAIIENGDRLASTLSVVGLYIPAEQGMYTEEGIGVFGQLTSSPS